MKAIDPVSADYLQKRVKVSDFHSHTRHILGLYEKDRILIAQFREKRGLSKYIRDELIPLAALCEKIKNIFADHYIQYFLGSKQSFDAKLIDPEGNVIKVIEITIACNGFQEAIASESLNLHGYTPLYSDVPYCGTKNNRIIPKPKIVVIDANHIVEECINMISLAVGKKSDMDKYRDATTLLVAFDDFRLLSIEHFNAVEEFVDSLKSSFPEVYYIGLHGNFYRHVVPT